MNASIPELDRLERLDRGALVGKDGRSLKDLRKSLTPRFARVWFDIGSGWAALLVTASALVLADHCHPQLLPLSALLGALAFGYTVAYLLLFFHEAAHFNIAPGRRRNDWLANAFLGVITGQDIAAYRVVHFDHHRYLGTPKDTEHSYWAAPDLRFLLEGITGISALRVLFRRVAHLEKAEPGHAKSGPRRGLGMLLVGLAFNGSILALAAWSGSWALLIAWPVGVLLVHPAINAFRQLLEHRSFDADRSVDYSKVPHGATARMFGSGPLASTLGGAGFNRHLLHHYEAQISYTRLPELESFLEQTAAAEVLRDAKTTYLRALLRLVRAS